MHKHPPKAPEHFSRCLANVTENCSWELPITAWDCRLWLAVCRLWLVWILDRCNSCMVISLLQRCCQNKTGADGPVVGVSPVADGEASTVPLPHGHNAPRLIRLLWRIHHYQLRGCACGMRNTLAPLEAEEEVREEAKQELLKSGTVPSLSGA